MGTRLNRLVEAVLTHDQCFEQTYIKNNDLFFRIRVSILQLKKAVMHEHVFVMRVTFLFSDTVCPPYPRPQHHV